MRALIKKFKPALNGLALAAHDRSVAIQLGFAVLAGLVGLGLGFVSVSYTHLTLPANREV